MTNRIIDDTLSLILEAQLVSLFNLFQNFFGTEKTYINPMLLEHLRFLLQSARWILGNLEVLLFSPNFTNLKLKYFGSLINKNIFI